MDISSAMSTIILMVTASLLFGTAVLTVEGAQVFGQELYTEVNAQRAENAILAVAGSDAAETELVVQDQQFAISQGTARVFYSQKQSGQTVELPNKDTINYEQGTDGRINMSEGLCISKSQQTVIVSQGC
jgi:hypothetical protein